MTIEEVLRRKLIGVNEVGKQRKGEKMKENIEMMVIHSFLRSHAFLLLHLSETNYVFLIYKILVSHTASKNIRVSIKSTALFLFTKS